MMVHYVHYVHNVYYVPIPVPVTLLVLSYLILRKKQLLRLAILLLKNGSMFFVHFFLSDLGIICLRLSHLFPLCNPMTFSKCIEIRS